MTSGNLQRWILPFSWNLNMKEDCESYQGTWNAGVEYYSICISLEFGSLNNVVGNIKSSIDFCALIWIVKATLALNTIQQRNMDITHPNIDKFLSVYLHIPMKDFSWVQPFLSKWRSSFCIRQKYMHYEWNVWKCIIYMLYVQWAQYKEAFLGIYASQFYHANVNVNFSQNTQHIAFRYTQIGPRSGYIHSYGHWAAFRHPAYKWTVPLCVKLTRIFQKLKADTAFLSTHSFS